MNETPYGYEKHLAGASLEEARARVIAALAAEGFGVLTEIDLQATLKKKLGVDLQPYIILGACNPKLAHRALTAEPLIGLMLPCNVVVAEAPDGALVSIANPRAMFGLVANEALTPVVREADERLLRVLDALG
ncbi:MAG: DUF302 domain-containing protein [Myxococcales bacterium]|nr:DUF302 domain-containing protein [Myxococcales bacterium]